MSVTLNQLFTFQNFSCFIRVVNWYLALADAAVRSQLADKQCESSGPQSFWHQGPISRKTVFPQNGGRRVGDVFEMIQVHYIYCTCYFYYHIRTTSDHQALDPGGWGPLLSYVAYVDSETRENKLVSTVPGIRFSILRVSQARDSVQF